MSNTYTRENVLSGALVTFTKVSEELKEGETDAPSCHCCGGPLYSEDEIFSTECDVCFVALIIEEKGDRQ